MKRLLLASAAALALAGTMAAATPFTDSLVASYQAQGYSRIEIETGPSQVKVEAIRDGRKVEVIYDAATGAVLSEEWDSADDGDDTAPGVTVRASDDDFLDDDRDDDDNSDDDENSDEDDRDEDDDDSDEDDSDEDEDKDDEDEDEDKDDEN